MKRWIVLHLLLVLTAQFAPTIHHAFPHEDEQSSCSHPGVPLHVEKSESESGASTCIFCVHHGSRSAPAVEFVRLPAEQISVRMAADPETVLPESLALLIPDSRGPPAGL
jgi:hypothetical protein